ncbi:unnamed protein product [Rhodiola kirilowii]
MSINASDPTQRQAPWMPPAPMHHHHQYNPAAHFAPPAHFMPYAAHQFQNLTPPQVAGSNGNNNNGENKTIWVGDLHQWMDETYLHNCFASTGEVSSMKGYSNKQTGLSDGLRFCRVSLSCSSRESPPKLSGNGDAQHGSALPFELGLIQHGRQAFRQRP